MPATQTEHARCITAEIDQEFKLSSFLFNNWTQKISDIYHTIFLNRDLELID